MWCRACTILFWFVRQWQTGIFFLACRSWIQAILTVYITTIIAHDVQIGKRTTSTWQLYPKASNAWPPDLLQVTYLLEESGGCGRVASDDQACGLLWEFSVAWQQASGWHESPTFLRASCHQEYCYIQRGLLLQWSVHSEHFQTEQASMCRKLPQTYCTEGLTWKHIDGKEDSHDKRKQSNWRISLLMLCWLPPLPPPHKKKIPIIDFSICIVHFLCHP